METAVRTPRQLFNLSQHLVVPLFQRRYVWEAEHQWQPLWDDITRTAELRRAEKDVSHFLGAAVLQALPMGVGDLQRWALIDGQQRVTTLQLVLDAVGAVLEEMGQSRLHARLERLTHNDAVDVDRDEDILKLRHQNDDGVTFREVMTAPAPVAHADLTDPEARLTRAHEFFTRQAQEWLGEDSERAEALTDTLLQGLQLVAITLQADEDSQEIFETLNARGTPLTAADLIKNFMIQRIQAEGGDADAAYHRHWQMFETRFWEKETSVGRMYVSRATLYLQQWLTSRLGEEVGHNRLFPRFKDYVDHRADTGAKVLLGEIATEAKIYQRWIEESTSDKANLSPAALSVYRYTQVDIQVAMPLMIWLHDPRRRVPESEVTRALVAVESWIMRRMLLRLTTADLGRSLSSLISALSDVPVDQVGQYVEQYLSRLSTASNYWPADDELRRTLQEVPAYRAFRRSRLRMMLEAVEDDMRGFTAASGSRASGRVRRGAMHIEHLLPQKWRNTWPVAEGDLAAEIRRIDHVHRLGNLTLLTRKLNSTVSNRPWLGEKGKLQALDQHDDNLMTRSIRRNFQEAWDEGAIDQRSADIVEALLRTWPVPEGHVGSIAHHIPESSEREVSVRHLVAAGLLEPGSELRSRSAKHTAVVTREGRLRVAGEDFEAPSGAGYAACGSGVNGWWFWALPDGRLLKDLRTELRERWMASQDGAPAASSSTVDSGPPQAAQPPAVAAEGWRS